MKSFAYLLLFFISPFLCDAQSPVASWEQIFNGETGRAVNHLNTMDGGVVLVTTTTDSVTGNSPTSILKSGINGNVMWSYRFGQSPYFVSNIVEAPDSTLLIAYTENQADDQKELHTLKLDANGNILSSTNYRLPPQYITGAASPALIARNNGRYVLASLAVDSITMLSRLHVTSLDTNGSVLWSNVYDSATTHIDGTFLDTCANGDVFVATSSSIGPGTEICVDIMRVTPLGNMLWYKHMILPNYHLRIVSLVATSIDSFYLVSSMYSPFTTLPELSVVLVNGFGNVLWSQRYNPPGVPWYISDAAVDENDQLVVSGRVEHSFFSNGSIVCMVNASGQVLYCNYSSWYYFTSVDYRGNGYFSVAGSSGMAYENPIYVLLDSTLHGCADVPFGLIVLNQNLSYTSGMGSAAILLQTNNDSLAQIAGTITSNLHCPPVGMQESSASGLKVYPIPASTNLVIESDIAPELIEIFGVTGEKVYSSSHNQKKTEIHVDNWTSGMYFMKVTCGPTTTTRKIIIE